MYFKKLPSNSEKLLHEIVCADNPVQVLCARFEKASQKEDDELRGIIRQLCQEGYIDVKWADNVPFFVTLNNTARVYEEQLDEFDAQKLCSKSQGKEVKQVIFISHRSTDKTIADMLVDFFSATGISRDKIFCSSLPGNDINEKISGEVKTALQNSTINIAILSYDYYQSAYCMNEAGIFWYSDSPVIPIALPEINSNNMYGFLNSEYKLRRLDSDTDISYIYDSVSEAVSTSHTKVSVITYENNKLRNRYTDFLKTRELSKPVITILPTAIASEITTDDERVVLYYILQKNVRKVSKRSVSDWLHKNEIYNINVDNAFDLLSSFGGGTVNNNTLEFGLEAFRKYSANSITLIPELKECVERHIKEAVNTFQSLWNSNTLDNIMELFIAYIVDERMCNFGDRWMADGQIENIKNWESKYTLDSTLSENYGSCLQFFIQNNLVYETDWTSYGNPREYSLCTSLQEFLFNCPKENIEKLQEVKNAHYYDLPF